MTRAALSALPFWPRHLSREEAARYVGVSVDVFDDEVAAGMWPPPRPRGARGGRLTWDRAALDLASDQGLTTMAATPSAPAAPVVAVSADDLWRKGLDAEAKGGRDQGRAAQAGRRHIPRASLPTTAA